MITPQRSATNSFLNVKIYIFINIVLLTSQLKFLWVEFPVQTKAGTAFKFIINYKFKVLLKINVQSGANF